MDERSLFKGGYRVIPSFVNAHELHALKDLVDRAASSSLHPGMSRPGNDLAPLRWCDDLCSVFLSDSQRLQLLHEAISPRDLKWISGYVSTKQPGSPPLYWHQDWWCWNHPLSFDRRISQIALVCYLTDTNRHSGALRVLPRSHHRSSPIHRYLPEPHAHHADKLPEDHPAMRDVEGQVTLDLMAGDAVILDYRLLHGTHPNATDRRRDCVLLSFVLDWAGLPQEIRAHLIAHPALPDESERQAGIQCGFRDLIPFYQGELADLTVSRVPPGDFVIA